MNINLSNEPIFKEDSIELDKKINFVFGKNGTGKSTLTGLIEEQNEDFDIRVFQGFDKVIGENKKLNAIIIGEENKEISKEIREKNGKIESLQKEKNLIENNISSQIDNKDNLYTEYIEVKENYENEKKKLDNILKEIAVKIKNLTNPQIAITSYNINNIKHELNNAKLLEKKEINILENILNEKPKKVSEIEIININFQHLLIDINNILIKEIKKRFMIPRIEDENEKSNFAKKGLEIHEAGDVCSFCGNIISEKEYNNLKAYFSAEDISEFENEINDYISKINEVKQKVNSIDINKDDFYIQFHTDIENLNNQINEKKDSIDKFLNKLIEILKEKQKNIFSKSEKINIVIPDTMDNLEREYKNLVHRNNSSELPKKQNDAKEKLRYHYIKKYLDEDEYFIKKNNFKNIKDNYHKLMEKREKEKDKVNNYDEQIKAIMEEIRDLESKTRSETALTERVNKKIKNYMTFELIHKRDEIQKGHYQVKCLRTNETRDINKISTGEKNIIAFLYFVEKINEIKDKSDRDYKEKLIIFDDPMTSNDDTMQYLLIEEIKNLMEEIRDKDKIIILTHNHHFYLNLTYGMNYKNNKFIRLSSDGNEIIINIITDRKDDFKTNYEALWRDLKFLYNSENADSNLLLNPMRRIIETFIKFNKIDTTSFYQKVTGSKKMFNVNSHSIDDHEADLLGNSKDEVLNIFKDCFIDNDFKNHFEAFWE